jgi:hypothetical protein
MRSFRTNKGRGLDDACLRVPGFHLDLHAVMAKQLPAGAPMTPLTPITPKERRRADHTWMQQDAHLARFTRLAPMPLALLASGAGATTADARRIYYAQAAIDLSTSLLDVKRVSLWTPQRSIRLKRNVCSRERAGWRERLHLECLHPDMAV